MTTQPEPPAESPLDVRTFLLGEAGPSALQERLVEAVESANGDRPEVASTLKRLGGEQLAEVVAGCLDVDLAAAAVAGWRRHSQLREAARETAAAPGLTVIVEVVRHRTTSTWRPRVELELGGMPLAHLELELVVAFEVVGLHASVTAGRLTALGGGDGHVEATFSTGGVCLKRRRAPFDARRDIRLGRGVPLLGRRAGVPAVRRPARRAVTAPAPGARARPTAVPSEA